MKKFFCLLLSLLCLCMTAAAEPRYPERQGNITDAAAVFSQSTMKDLTQFADEVANETSIRFYVATVDFLDGASLSNYANGLRQYWLLDDDELLLLLAVGEDKFGSFGGAKVNHCLSSQVQDKLLSAYLQEPFLQQRYDDAISRYIPALTSELNKSFDGDIDLNGFFGQVQETTVNWADEWSTRLDEFFHEDEPTPMERVTHEDKDTGFSLGKVILTIFLLSVIFGKRRSRRGCNPFTRLFAALGLWKLWNRK